MAHVAPLASLGTRVDLLEADSADHQRDDDEAASVPAGLLLVDQQVNAFVKNVTIAGKVTFAFEILEPSAPPFHHRQNAWHQPQPLPYYQHSNDGY